MVSRWIVPVLQLSHPFVTKGAMIVYELQCECGLAFEGWFRDRTDFRNQQEEGLLACPTCGSASVRKVLSPVVSLSASPSVAPHQERPPEASGAKTQPAEQLIQAMQLLVRDQFRDVGAKFAEKALKMHYGVDKPENIRGVTSEQEKKMLAGEGIEFLSIPMPTEEGKPN